MANAVIYARYSSDNQRAESIDAQVRACKEYAAKHGITVSAVYADEAISGKGSKTAHRAQYQKLLRDCSKRAFDTILVHKYDRVARNVAEHVNLVTRLDALGINLIAVAQDFGNGAEAKIMRTLMWSLSEYYLENLSNEVRKGQRENALKAVHNGGHAPFGYDVSDGKFVVNAFEAAFVRKIFDAALNRRGFKEIIQKLAANGIKGRCGATIRYPQIHEILRNEKYTGTYIYHPIESDKQNIIKIENAFPAIIDKTIFEEVQSIMNARKQAGRRAGYLCSGLVYCTCGAKMHGVRIVKKEREYRYYCCSKKCGAPNVRMSDIDAAATSYLYELLSEANQQRIAEALTDYRKHESEHVKDFYLILERKINDKKSQYDALLSNLSSGVLPPEVVTDIANRMQKIKAEIDCLQHTEPPKDFTPEVIRNWLESLKNAPDEAAVHLLIKRIDMQKNKTEFSIQSTLASILGNIGCDRAH